MKLGHEKLKQNIIEYNKEFPTEQLGMGQIQKIYSTPHLICLGIRYRGKSSYLYFGRGSRYQGCWMGDKFPPSPFRIRDRFLEYLRKFLKGTKIGNIKFNEENKIAYISYLSKEGPGGFGLYWKGNDLYFLNLFSDKKGKNLFIPWLNLTQKISPSDSRSSIEIINHFFLEENYGHLKKEENNSSETSPEKFQGLELEEYFLEQEEKLKSIKAPSRKRKFFERKLRKIKNDLEKLGVWQELYEVLSNPMELDLAGNKFKFKNATFKFNRDWGKGKKIDYIYTKLKSFKKHESLLQERLEECEIEFRNFKEKGLRNEEKRLGKIVLPKWSEKKSKQQDRSKNLKDLIKIYSIGQEFKLGVGRNIHGNDYLRSQWGKKGDIWFHIENEKSAHGILKNLGKMTPNEEIFQIIGSALRDLSLSSVGKISIINLIYSDLKNIKGVKGQPGKVTVKKPRYLRVSYLEKWQEIVSSS